jgi:hypothetical protein
MKVYLVYGLDKDDLCDEPYVKKAFANETEAKKYRNSKVENTFDCHWYVSEIEVE